MNQKEELKTDRNPEKVYSILQKKINDVLDAILKSKSTVPLSGGVIASNRFMTSIFSVASALGGISEEERQKIEAFNAAERLGMTYIINDIINTCTDKGSNYTPLPAMEKNKLNPLHQYFFPDHSGNWNATVRFLSRQSLKDERAVWIKATLGEHFNEIVKLCTGYQELHCASKMQLV